MDEKISKIIVEDPHGNPIAGRKISPSDLNESIAEHNESPDAHPHITRMVEVVDRQAKERLSEHDASREAHPSIQRDLADKIEELYVDDHGTMTPMTRIDGGRKVAVLPKDSMGKVDDVKVNGISVLGENNVANIAFSASVDGSKGVPNVTPTLDENGINLAFSGLKGEDGQKGDTGGKGDKGDRGDSAVFDPTTGNIATIKQTMGGSTESPMSQQAVTEAVRNSYFRTAADDGFNLLDISTTYSSVYPASNGAITPLSGYDMFAFPCAGGATLAIKTYITSDAVCIYAYDKDMKPLSVIARGPINTLGGNQPLQVVTPTATAFVFLPCNVAYISGVQCWAVTNGKEYSALPNTSFADKIASLIGYKGFSHPSLSGDAIHEGYIDLGGAVQSGNTYSYSSPIAVSKGQMLFFSGTAASTVSLLSLSNESGTSLTIVKAGNESGTYMYLVKEDGYIVVSARTATINTLYISSASIYEYLNTTINSLSNRISTNTAALSLLERYEIRNNLRTQDHEAAKQGIAVTSGTYGASGAKYEIPASSIKNTTGICHISFDFALREDVNVGDGVDKTFFSIRKPYTQGEYYVNFLLHCEKTAVFSGKEAKDSHTLNTTTSGVPRFRSKFGTSCNYTGGDAPARLNMFMGERTMMYDNSNKSNNYKPLCGRDLFSIEIRAVDGNNEEIENTRSSAAQAIYQAWQQSYIEITDTEATVVTPSNTYTYDFEDYATISAMFTAMYNELNDRIEDGAKIVIKDISSYYHGTYTTANICKCKMFLGSQHPYGSSSFYDGFPCFIPYALDGTWHTFELLSIKEMNKMYFCIDGQYYGTADARNWSIGNVRYLFNGARLVLGGDLNVTYRNILIESNDYIHAEASGSLHYIISRKNPYILNYFMHEMYYTPYFNDIGATIPAGYFKFVSEGGRIPDGLKNANANYKGDDCIQNGRKSLAFPSWSIKDLLVRLEASHYMCITKKDLHKVLSGEIVNPYNRYYILDVDDHQTYIYDREDCRRVFENHHSKPCMALELGFYVSSDMPSEEAGYDTGNFVTNNCKDTDAHRQKLQRRVASMLSSGWAVDIHGSVEGYTFQGKTCNEIRAEIKAATNICKHYGWPITAWCYAANYYTPNACKLIEEAGIEFGTSTESQPISKCRLSSIIPRVMITSNLTNTKKVII